MNHFNIRVYGILINSRREVLLSDEKYKNISLTKFPGGGLEFGEGIHDCLKREWKEELDIEIVILEHFYTTDFFQVSAFDSHAQIISVYYLIKTMNEEIDFRNALEHNYRWVSLDKLHANDLTMPIDKIVGARLLDTI